MDKANKIFDFHKEMLKLARTDEERVEIHSKAIKRTKETAEELLDEMRDAIRGKPIL